MLIFKNFVHGYSCVVTAAKCLFLDAEDRYASPVEVLVVKPPMSTWSSEPSVGYRCKNYRVHEYFDTVHGNGMVPNDIAVIKLSIHFDMDDMEIEELPPCSDAIDPSEGHSCRNILESKVF